MIHNDFYLRNEFLKNKKEKSWSIILTIIINFHDSNSTECVN